MSYRAHPTPPSNKPLNLTKAVVPAGTARRGRQASPSPASTLAFAG